MAAGVWREQKVLTSWLTGSRGRQTGRSRGMTCLSGYADPFLPMRLNEALILRMYQGINHWLGQGSQDAAKSQSPSDQSPTPEPQGHLRFKPQQGGKKSPLNSSWEQGNNTTTYLKTTDLSSSDAKMSTNSTFLRSMTPSATPNYLTKGRLTVKNSKWKENNPLHYGLNMCSLHTHTLTTACSVSSRDSYTHFWSPRAPGSLMDTTYTQKPVKQ